ncbi:MAG: hypothetical protein K940chlam7_01477 [Chlamydiae bacterium]|nr:hypothetical protein [Chlamydiota bacterium]
MLHHIIDKKSGLKNLTFWKSHFYFVLYLGLFLILHSPTLHSYEPSRILYLMQSGDMCSALKLYHQQKEETGEHNLDIIQKMGLILLDQGYNSSDPDIQLLTLFGSGISANDSTQYILEEAIKSCNPQFQLIALNFLSKFHNDDANDEINRLMSSDFLAIRLEACYHLAEMQHPKASGQIESLLQKVPPEAISLFPQLFAMTGDAESIKSLQRLMNHPLEAVRIEAILSAAKFGRDDLLPDIRRLSSHLRVSQQEACAVAFGQLKDENSVQRLQTLAQSTTTSVRLAALQALYRLGREEVRQNVEEIAKEENLFAILLLGEMQGAEPLLLELAKSKNIHARVNAALALLELGDSRSLPALCNIFLKDSRDLAFVKTDTFGKGLHAWKVIPSARQNLQDNPIALELSLNMRETALEKALDLPEKAFLNLAHTLLELQQNDLVPLLSRLLENLQTPSAIELLKIHREQIGAPLIRNYCNLALYSLKEVGPYRSTLHAWMASKKQYDLIQFRPYVPWEKRNVEAYKYQLTPQETSRLLVEAFESLIQTQDENAIDILLHAIQYGNRKNRYALAGLLIRATN